MSAPLARVITDGAELAALAPAWRELARRCAATPFQGPAWLLPWWETFAPGPLAAIAVETEGRLVALAPLWREDGPYGRRLLPLGIGLSDYTDVLVDPAHPMAGAALVEAALGIEGWQTWSLEDLAPDAQALGLPVTGAVRDRSEPQSACPVLALPPAPDRLGEAIPSGKLRKVRMARNRSARREGFRVETVDAAGIPDFLDLLFDLHGARWATRGEGGVLADDVVRRFHRRAAPALRADGLARFYTMSLEGRVVGAYYGLCDERRAYAYLGGFDPAHAFESPGTVLIAHAIEAAIGEGATEFDFLRGQEPYKYDWGAVDRWSQRRTIQREPAHA